MPALKTLAKSHLRFPLSGLVRDLLFRILGGAGTIETKTSGALSAETRTSLLSVTGTQAFSLPDGLFEGQRKTLKCSVAATVPVGTVTPATATGFTTVTFDAVTDDAELEWHFTGGWHNCGGTAAFA